MGSWPPGRAFLALRVTTGVTPILAIYFNGLNVTAAGNTFGTLDTGVTTSDQPVNRAVYFMGNNVYGTSSTAGAIYAAVGGSIYRSFDGGNSWVVATALPSIHASFTAFKSGLNIVTGGDGLQYLCLLYADSTLTSIRGVRSTDGFTWTSDGPSNFTGPFSGFTNDAVLGSALYCVVPGIPACIAIYDVSTGKISAVAPPTGSGDQLVRASMCVWDNNIYVASYISTGGLAGTRPLYLLSGGLLLQVANLATLASGATATNKMGMFVDGSALYVFSLQVASSTGWGCYQIDTPGTYTVTNITSAVISGAMAGAGPGASSRVLALVEGDVAPGTNPQKSIYYSADGTAATSFRPFVWNGPNTAMTDTGVAGTGGDVVHALTVSKRVSSNGNYAPFGTYPYVISSGPTTSGTVGWRINYTLWGPIGNTTSIRLWYGGPNEEYQVQVGTLASPSGGTLGVNNTSIVGLTIDDGFTLYSFTWVPPTAITDAVNSRFNFYLEPF